MPEAAETPTSAPAPPSRTPVRPARAGYAAPEAPARAATRVALLVKCMRPRQWTKNLLLFAGVTFAGRLLDPTAVLRATLAFALFCLLAGATYIINDLADVRADQLHPLKRFRALASGRLPIRSAWLGVAGALALAAALLAVIEALPQAGTGRRLAGLFPPRFAPSPAQVAYTHDAYARLGGSGLLFALTAVGYLALMLAYTYKLKHIVLLDVFTIAAGFVLRAMAGAFVVAVRVSPWLYLCTILLALFLALGKRRQELALLSAGASDHRRNLSEYSAPLLDQLITIVTAATIMAYSLYTFQGEAGDQRLMVTIPFVLYGIFRYLYLVYARNEGGSPEEVLLKDAHVRWSVILCALTIGFVLYVVPK
ncbi:MAG TPA: decaprenyl-phosphate phosphoribosyltransferase [Ktedonobacterales bacterium]|nr:decaprenyl-phosphate phosphoribosyltransferase [Ktedonobacterales bacterium]